MSHKRGIFYKATIRNVGWAGYNRGAQFSESLDPINIFQNDLSDAPSWRNSCWRHKGNHLFI